MIICLNARNQENVSSGSREKCITGACVQGWLGPIYIKLQKQLYEIKMAAFFSFCRICTWTAQVLPFWKQKGKENRWEPLSDVIGGFSQNHNLKNFEEFRRDIWFNFKDFWGGLASTFYFALFIFLSPFSQKLQRYHHDLEKALFTNSCVMDLHVKQATTLAKNSSI